MKPAPFAYARPSTLEEALQALAADPEAKVLAGGQSLVPLLSMRLAGPSALVDINGLDELDYVRSDAHGVRVGALARHSRVERDREAARVQPLLAQALGRVAHPTIRNRGTTLGSIVHADAAGEMPMVLRLLEGEVTATSPRGTRQVPAAELFLGPMESTLAGDEIATEAVFPALPDGAGTAFDEVARRNGDYALAGVAAVVGTDERGLVTQVRAGYLSLHEVPVAVDLSEVFTERSEAGEQVDQHSLDAAADLALEELEPDDDVHATADYRRRLARVLTRRVVASAYEEATRRRTTSIGGTA